MLFVMCAAAAQTQCVMPLQLRAERDVLVKAATDRKKLLCVVWLVPEGGLLLPV